MLWEVFQAIGVQSAFYVEIGTQSGVECNTRMWRERHGWQGLMLDGGYENPAINLKKAFVTADNVAQLLASQGVPEEFDLLSIDIDGQDWHVWRALPHRPRVVVIEFLMAPGGVADLVMPYRPAHVWTGGYCGASLRAMCTLGQSKGYTLVGGNVVNAIFVRDDQLPAQDFAYQGDAEGFLRDAAQHCGHLPHGLFRLVSWEGIVAEQAKAIRAATEEGWREAAWFLAGHV